MLFDTDVLRQLVINFVFLARRKISMFRVSEFWAHSFYSSFLPDYLNNRRFFVDCIKISQFKAQRTKKIACRASRRFVLARPSPI